MDNGSNFVTKTMREYCTTMELNRLRLPRLNLPFERYKFYRRQQQDGESLDQYATALRQLADRCDFTNITPDGISLTKVIDTCRAAELSQAQIRK